MDRDDHDRFTYAIELLQSYYPKSRHDDAETRAKKWAKQFSRFPIDTIERAIETMPDVSPEWLPSIGTVIMACRAIEREAATAKIDEAKESRQRTDDENYNRFLASIPNDEIVQQQWIDDAPNAFERLNREWTVDAKRKGRKADSILTPDIVRDRIAKLLATMEDKDG